MKRHDALSIPVTVMLPPETQARLSAMAATIGQAEAWVIEQAVEGYLALQADHLLAIEAGQLIPHEAVADWVRSWDNQDERPPAA